MKLISVIAVVCILALSTATFGRDSETLIRGDIHHGFYLGQSTKFSSIEGEFAPLMGGRAGWIIDRTFIIGGAGYALLDKVDTDHLVSGEPVEIMLAYGGLQLLYVVNPQRLVQYEVGTLVGFGGLNYRGSADEADLPNSDHIFVIEPEVIVGMNITNYVRVSSGISYRWVSGLEFEDVVEGSDVSGLAVSLMLNFGSF